MNSREWDSTIRDFRAARRRMEYRHWRPDLFGPQASVASPVSVEEALESAKPKDQSVLDLTPEDAKMLIEMGISPNG